MIRMQVNTNFDWIQVVLTNKGPVSSVWQIKHVGKDGLSWIFLAVVYLGRLNSNNQHCKTLYSAESTGLCCGEMKGQHFYFAAVCCWNFIRHIRQTDDCFTKVEETLCWMPWTRYCIHSYTEAHHSAPAALLREVMWK